MTKRRNVLVWTVAIGLALCLDSPAFQQRPLERPTRIVSLVPATTEMLFALGAGDRVVGVGSFDRFPPEVERIPRVGALLDPDVERILALRPDLVVVYRSQADLLAQLARAQIPTFVYAHAGLADVTATLRELGARVGAGDRATTLAADIERRIDATRKRHAGGGRPKTLVVMGRDALALRGIYASGGIGFLHDMLEAAGGDDVLGDIKRESVQATTELILARKPEVILEIRPGSAAAASIESEIGVWRTLGSVPAVRAGRVHFIVDPRMVVPGPRVAEAAELLARALHPEVFGK